MTSFSVFSNHVKVLFLVDTVSMIDTASCDVVCTRVQQLYTQARMRWRGSRLLRHFLQVVCLYAAIFIAASRVSDYKHHWSDVLGGAILGTVVAVMVVSGLPVYTAYCNFYRVYFCILGF